MSFASSRSIKQHYICAVTDMTCWRYQHKTRKQMTHRQRGTKKSSTWP